MRLILLVPLLILSLLVAEICHSQTGEDDHCPCKKISFCGMMWETLDSLARKSISNHNKEMNNPSPNPVVDLDGVNLGVIKIDYPKENENIELITGKDVGRYYGCEGAQHNVVEITSEEDSKILLDGVPITIDDLESINPEYIDSIIINSDGVNKEGGIETIIIVTKKQSPGKSAIPKYWVRFMSVDQTFEFEPFLILDGVPYPLEYLYTIDKGDIENIFVIKEPGKNFCHRSNDAIVVTTFISKTRTLLIKDLFDSKGIPGATVSFISMDKRKHFMVTADDSGKLVTDKIVGWQYFDLVISAVGYKSYSKFFVYSSECNGEVIHLVRDIKLLPEVVITSTVCPRWIRCWGTAIVTREKNNAAGEEKVISYKVFPNPVLRGGVVTFELDLGEDGPLQTRIITLDGRVIALQSQQTFKGFNRISIPADTRWSAGIYFVQVLSADEKLIAQEKIIIQ